MKMPVTRSSNKKSKINVQILPCCQSLNCRNQNIPVKGLKNKVTYVILHQKVGQCSKVDFNRQSAVTRVFALSSFPPDITSFPLLRQPSSPSALRHTHPLDARNTHESKTYKRKSVFHSFCFWRAVEFSFFIIYDEACVVQKMRNIKSYFPGY